MNIDRLILFLVENPCENSNILRVILYIRKILEFAFIAVPIVLIVLITFDFIKNVTANSEDTMKKNQKIVIKRIIYCILIFFVMPIVNLVFSAFGTSNNEDKITGESNGEKVSYLSCWDNAKNLETIQSFENKVTFKPNGGNVYGEDSLVCYSSSSCEVIVPKATKSNHTLVGWQKNGDSKIYAPGETITISNGDEYIAIWEKKEEIITPTPTPPDNNDNGNNDDGNNGNNDNSNNNTTPPSTGSETFIGTKYNLTDTELKGLAYLCQQEQGSATGAAYEAALIANRYELFGNSYSSIVEYAKNSGWWYKGYETVSNPGSVSTDVLNSVKDVLVNGNRPMPQYIDEHDCISCGSYGFDVEKIVVNGQTITSESGRLNRSNYIKSQTVIYNKYGSVYTFWVFPTEYSDPFGYTDYAYNLVMGN